MLKYSFVYSDPTRETVTITVDDFTLIEAFLKDVMKELKSCAWNNKALECRDYCNLYLDLENEFNLIKDIRAVRIEKERLEKERAEVAEKEDDPEVVENDPHRQGYF